MSLLPPSLSDYTNYSQTLPIRGKYSRRHSSSISSEDGTSLNKTDHSQPPNTIYVPRALMNPTLSKTPSPTTSTSIVTEDTDGEKPTSGEISVAMYSSTDTKQLTSVRYGGKTPGEIVTSALRNRRPAGGLKKAINMYQENRRQFVNTHKVSEESKKLPSRDDRDEQSDRLQLIESGERSSASAGK